MKLSYQWLKELLPALKANPSQVADKLGASGFEIEAIISFGSNLPGVIVAQVEELAPHPQADRLKVCQVNTGNEIVQIVCGASNVQAGKKYPLATVGATLPNGTVIQKASLRGVESFGMLCSEQELGLVESASGLYELPDNTKVGAAFSKLFGDTVLEVATPPNRGDALSHWGLAREVAAHFGLAIKLPAVSKIKGQGSYKKQIAIKISDRKNCRRYNSRVIEGVKIAPSPEWLSRRLKAVGVRPINNVVDATNYVMMELGHPLHAFDHRFLKGQKIEVRTLTTDTDFETLDHITRKLVKGDLVIADGEAPVALAGIMGGTHSEVRDDTTTLVLEAACFDPDAIRKTARRLGIKTESSYRFERIVDASSVRLALDRLTTLILEIAGGTASADVFESYTVKPKTISVKLSQEKLESIVGEKISAPAVTKVFKNLSLPVKFAKNVFVVSVPSFRHDIRRDVDLIEEYVRFRGFDSITSQLPPALHRPIVETTESRHEDPLKRYFKNNGFSETLHYSFTSPDILKKWDASLVGVTLKNPLSPELSVLRPALLPDLLNSVSRYKNSYKNGVRLFEVRTVFSASGQEHRRFSAVFAGEFFPDQWQGGKRSLDFFFGKGLLEDWFEKGKIPASLAIPSEASPYFHPFQQMDIVLNDKRIGVVGKVHPEILARFEIAGDLYAFDLDYTTLSASCGALKKKFIPYSDLPRVGRDMALLIDKKVSFDQLKSAIEQEKVQWLKEIRLFDLYQGDKISADKKSIALALQYESADKTLTDEEVNAVHFRLIESLKQKLGVELRGA